jgi:hypothetical protein
MIDGLNLSQIQRFRVALASKHPARWQVLRGKSGFNVVDIRSRPGGEELLTVSATNGVIPRSQTTVTMFKAQSYIGHKLCWPRDLVVNRLRAWMQGLGFFQAPRSHQFGLQRLSAKTLLCQALAILSLPTPVLPPQRAARRDGQVDFKGEAKVFVRTYGFLSSILPYTNTDWEKLSIFLNFLIPKLPAPEEQDPSKGILEAIDMDSYRVEKQAAIQIQLPDADAEIAPVPTSGGGHMPEPELDRLSNILKAFNDQFGNIDWKDADKISKVITEEIPAKVVADKAYQNAMKNSDKQNARIEHDIALKKVLVGLLSDHTELFKQFSENPAFQKWLADTVFTATYNPPGR